MSRHVVTIAVLAAMLAAPQAKASTLAVVVRDSVTLDASVEREFQRESERGLRNMFEDRALTLSFRTEDQITRGESFDRLIVVSFTGDCSLRMPQTLARRGPLGSTLVTDGRILPFVTIDCDRVKSTLARAEELRRTLIPAGILGRALSRVVLHEIYHVVSERSHHDATGVFRAEYSVSDLLSPNVHLSNEMPVPLIGSAGGSSQ